MLAASLLGLLCAFTAPDTGLRTTTVRALLTPYLEAEEGLDIDPRIAKDLFVMSSPPTSREQACALLEQAGGYEIKVVPELKKLKVWGDEGRGARTALGEKTHRTIARLLDNYIRWVVKYAAMHATETKERISATFESLRSQLDEKLIDIGDQNLAHDPVAAELYANFQSILSIDPKFHMLGIQGMVSAMGNSGSMEDLPRAIYPADHPDYFPLSGRQWQPDDLVYRAPVYRVTKRGISGELSITVCIGPDQDQELLCPYWEVEFPEPWTGRKSVETRDALNARAPFFLRFSPWMTESIGNSVPLSSEGVWAAPDKVGEHYQLDVVDGFVVGALPSADVLPPPENVEMWAALEFSPAGELSIDLSHAPDRASTVFSRSSLPLWPDWANSRKLKMAKVADTLVIVNLGLRHELPAMKSPATYEGWTNIELSAQDVEDFNREWLKLQPSSGQPMRRVPHQFQVTLERSVGEKTRSVKFVTLDFRGEDRVLPAYQSLILMMPVPAASGGGS
jgi:hypothetical protein